jgi:hypothetical protein
MTKTLIASFAFLAVLIGGGNPAFGQATTTSTTLSSAVTANTAQQICVASATGIAAPIMSAAGTYLVVDREAVQVASAGSSSTCWNVKRGQLGTSAGSAHLSGAKVWVGNVATGTGDTSRPFSGAFIGSVPSGSCTASAQYTLPVIFMGNSAGIAAASAVYTCAGGVWGRLMEQYVPPTQCTFAPTTLTTTNTYIQVGASAAFVLNGTSNAAAGTNTLTCNILPPTNNAAFRGAVLADITLFVGSQTTAPTSLGTSTLGSITFPAAATTEVASTVTPVAVGGTVTTTSPTLITTVTTAGSFLTIKHTYGTPLVLNTDLQVLQYTMPFLQSAAAAMTLNTPGLLVHYLIAD